MLGSFLPAASLALVIPIYLMSLMMPPIHELWFSACILVGRCINLLLVPRFYPLKLRCSLKHYFVRLLSSDTLVAKCLFVSFRGVLPS